MKYQKKFITLLLIVTSFLPAFALEYEKQTSKFPDTLRIGIAGSEPFIFLNDIEPKGIAIEIWEELAQENNWEYKYKPFSNVEHALKELDNKHIDILVGPISITSDRSTSFSFSQPFYNSSLAILSKVQDKTLWEKIKPLFSLKLLGAVGIFLTILAIVGTLIWLAERRKSPDQFPIEWLGGVGTGMWLAIVTMTTTGYGDKAPITPLGRIITGAWMIISILFATSMIAGIASVLTISTMNNTPYSTIEQLNGHKVATIKDSPSADFLIKNKVSVKAVDNLEKAISELTNSKVDAVVYDRPQLLYHLKNYPNDNLLISKAEYYKQGYGFAFNINDSLTHEVNVALLYYAESQEINRIIHHYLQKDE